MIQIVEQFPHVTIRRQRIAQFEFFLRLERFGDDLRRPAGPQVRAGQEQVEGEFHHAHGFGYPPQLALALVRERTVRVLPIARRAVLHRNAVAQQIEVHAAFLRVACRAALRGRCDDGQNARSWSAFCRYAPISHRRRRSNSSSNRPAESGLIFPLRRNSANLASNTSLSGMSPILDWYSFIACNCRADTPGNNGASASTMYRKVLK